MIKLLNLFWEVISFNYYFLQSFDFFYANFIFLLSIFIVLSFHVISFIDYMKKISYLRRFFIENLSLAFFKIQLMFYFWFTFSGYFHFSILSLILLFLFLFILFSFLTYHLHFSLGYQNIKLFLTYFTLFI